MALAKRVTYKLKLILFFSERLIRISRYFCAPFIMKEQELRKLSVSLKNNSPLSNP